MISFLPSHSSKFPDVSQAGPDGLLAIGGNLQPTTLLKAYAQGIFPWFNPEDPICWYAPPERCVLFPQNIKISKSMRQILRQGRFSYTTNQCFEDVMRRCATASGRQENGTWISEQMVAAYLQLHRLGHAMSVEVWLEEQLVGGLYGVLQGKVFCGESMFSLRPNASKAALIYLCQHGGFSLIDCQVQNQHLLSMGAVLISREEFMNILEQEKNAGAQ